MYVQINGGEEVNHILLFILTYGKEVANQLNQQFMNIGFIFPLLREGCTALIY